MKYRNPEILKHLRFGKDKAKLLDEDLEDNDSRILLCHITRVGTPPAAGCQLARSNGCRRKKLKFLRSKSHRAKRHWDATLSGEEEEERERNYLSDYSEEEDPLPQAVPQRVPAARPAPAKTLGRVLPKSKSIKKPRLAYLPLHEYQEPAPARKPVDFKQCVQSELQARKLQTQYDRLFTCRLEDQKSKRDRLKEAMRKEQQSESSFELPLRMDELPPQPMVRTRNQKMKTFLHITGLEEKVQKRAQEEAERRQARDIVNAIKVVQQEPP